MQRYDNPPTQSPLNRTYGDLKRIMLPFNALWRLIAPQRCFHPSEAPLPSIRTPASAQRKQCKKLFNWTQRLKDSKIINDSEDEEKLCVFVFHRKITAPRKTEITEISFHKSLHKYLILVILALPKILQLDNKNKTCFILYCAHFFVSLHCYEQLSWTRAHRAGIALQPATQSQVSVAETAALDWCLPAPQGRAPAARLHWPPAHLHAAPSQPHRALPGRVLRKSHPPSPFPGGGFSYAPGNDKWQMTVFVFCARKID